nr:MULTISPECIES: Tum protein [unclassified Pantoea]
MLERVELIARLTSEGLCKERDREIALSLIAEIASSSEMANKQFSVVFSAVPLEK